MEHVTTDDNKFNRASGSEQHHDGRKLREILDTANDAFVAINSASIITDWNRQAEVTFGWSREEAIGRPLSEVLIPTRHRKAHDNGLQRFLTTGEGPVLGKRIELPALHKSGREIPVELTISAVSQDDGGHTFAAFLHDISERKRAEKTQSVQLAITRITAEAVNVQEAFYQSIAALCQGLAWQYGAVWMAEGDGLSCSEVWHSQSPELSEFEKVSRTISFQRGQGLPGQVWATGRPTWLRDISVETHLPRSSAAAKASLHGTAAFPIWDRTEFLGVIELLSSTPQEPDERLLEMMADVGSRLGIFVGRKRSEMLVRQAEARERELAEIEFRTIFELAAVGAAQIDPVSRRFLKTNPTFHQLTGYNQDESVFLTIDDITHRDDLVDSREHFGELLEGRSSSQAVEKRFIRKNGSIAWVSVTGTVVRDGTGVPLRVLALYQDITDRKVTEAEQRFLAEASKTLSALDYQTNLVNLANLLVPKLADWCGVDIVDDNDSIKRLAVAHVDPAKVQWAKDLHDSYPEQPSSPRGVSQVIRTGDAQLFVDIHDDLLVAAARDEQHLKMLREIGMLSAIIVPLENGGKVLGALTMVTAESGRKYGARDLAFALEVAKRAAMAIENARIYRESVTTNRLKDEFLATLSHELRTPMNSIVGWTDLLRNKEVGADEIDAAIEVIHRNAHAQVQLINDLLDVSRIITGKLHIVPRPVNLLSIVSNAVASVSFAAKAKAIRIQVSSDTDVDDIPGDPDRLQQVVWNLLTNAIRFSAKDTSVTVTLRRVGSNAEIQVTDKGEGIDADFLPHVFDRFRQQDSSMTRRHGGLGLGLAIVRHIVDAHGGTVRAASPGCGLGATFTVKLPISTPFDQPESSVPLITKKTTQEGPIQSQQLSGFQVLVVDDDYDARKMLRKILSNHGAKVLEAASAGEAMQIIKSYRLALIVSDIGMPDVDGYELIRLIRSLPDRAQATLPAIALTAYARDEDRNAALAAGYFDHVIKPVNAKHLVERAVKAIGYRAGDSQGCHRK